LQFRNFASPPLWPSAGVPAPFLNHGTKLQNIFYICKYYNKKDTLKGNFFQSSSPFLGAIAPE